MIAGIDPADPEALELLSFSRRKHPGVPVVLLFPVASPDRTREAMRMGATAVLKFPMPATELRAAVTQACEKVPTSYRTNGATNGSMNGHSQPSLSRTGPEVRPASPEVRPAPVEIVASSTLRVDPFSPSPVPTVLGEDPTLRQAVELASTVAPARVSVLIVGEQGTGKTLISRAIHGLSSRGEHPFVEVSCSGIDELGLERELFGQVFGGSEASERPGRLARAHRGTILIDEVAALSPALQARLLGVLIDGEYEPHGGSAPIKVDVRFVFSTRENLSALVEQGKFSRELHDRINVVCLKLSPLRSRGRDIVRLAEHFREKSSRDHGKAVVGFTPEALDLLARHDWPGNVRELESVIQRGVSLAQGPRITPANLAIGHSPIRASRPSPFAPRGHHNGFSLRPLKEALEEPEKQIIIQALRALNWNRQETARVLDINRTTLYKKMKKYGLADGGTGPAELRGRGREFPGKCLSTTGRVGSLATRPALRLCWPKVMIRFHSLAVRR